MGFVLKYVEATTICRPKMKKKMGTTRLVKVPGDAKDQTFSDYFLIFHRNKCYSAFGSSRFEEF